MAVVASRHAVTSKDGNSGQAKAKLACFPLGLYEAAADKYFLL